MVVVFMSVIGPTFVEGGAVPVGVVPVPLGAVVVGAVVAAVALGGADPVAGTCGPGVSPPPPPPQAATASATKRDEARAT
jgi:hypothetical protein